MFETVNPKLASRSLTASVRELEEHMRKMRLYNKVLTAAAGIAVIAAVAVAGGGVAAAGTAPAAHPNVCSRACP